MCSASKRWSGAAGGLICLVLVGCGRQPPRADAQADAGPPPTARYWLSHTQLLSIPGGAPSASVDEPVLVDFWANGRVKSLAGSTPVLDGYLPEDVRTEPQTNRGLMLIAQSKTELHWASPEGALAGYLHPGAWVSVIPSADAYARVGKLPFAALPQPSRLFTKRAELGVARRDLQAPQRERPLRAVQLPLLGWAPLNSPSRSESGWTMNSCRDTLVLQNPPRLSQYARGVELIGVDEDRVGEQFLGANFYETRTCPAHAVSKPGEQMLWNDPDTELPPIAITQLPEHYRRPGFVEPIRVAVALGYSNSLFWLARNADGLSCEEWQLALKHPPQPPAIRSGSLTRRKLFSWGTPQRVSFAFSYLPATGTGHSLITLEDPKFNGKHALRCDCNYRYAVLDFQGEELTLMARPLPDALEAYDPGEAERWFLSDNACQAARVEGNLALARDPASTTRVGLHAVLGSLGI